LDTGGSSDSGSPPVTYRMMLSRGGSVWPKYRVLTSVLQPELIIAAKIQRTTIRVTNLPLIDIEQILEA
jgi:hypothetical protein